MKCIYCGYSESKVVDSRPLDDGTSTRRRRECLKCQRRFTTYEKAELTPMMVIKKDGSREMFDLEKVRRGIIKACEKRPVALEDIELLVRSIETRVCQMPDQEVTTDQIGLLVMDGLKALDEVAYIRFASVYRRFQDVSGFVHEINKFLEEK